MLDSALGITGVQRPVLVHRICCESDPTVDEAYQYSFARLDATDRRSLHTQVGGYLEHVGKADDLIYFKLAGG